MVGQLGHGCVTAGEAPDDPKAVHVSQRLVKDTQLAKVFGLGDGCGNRAADSGGRGRQGVLLRLGVVDSRINYGLYQSALMLAGPGVTRQAPLVQVLVHGSASGCVYTSQVLHIMLMG